jgi:hypothetical protein
MPRIQELIHSLESGLLGRAVSVAALLLAVVTMAVVFDLREFQNFRNEEAMDVSQVARNLAEGRGFTTRYIRPLSMGMVMRHGGDRDPKIKDEHPDLAHAPLYPLLLAGFMKIPGLFDYEIISPKEGQFRRHGPDLLIATMNQGLFFLAIALTWLLARRLFDNTVATLTAILMLGCDMLWQFSASGLSTMLALVFFVALANILALLDEGTRTTPAMGTGRAIVLAAAAGILCGALLLTRYALGSVLVAVLVFLAAGFPGRRAILPVVTALFFLATASPWMVRNVRVCGNPFGLAPYSLIQETTNFTENWLERTPDPDLKEVGTDDITRKFFLGAADVVRQEIPAIGGSWLTSFFLAGLLIPFVNLGRSKLRWFTLAAIGVLSTAQILCRTHLSNDVPRINSENLLVLATPLVFIFGAAIVCLLVYSLELPTDAWRNPIYAGVTLVMWIPLLITFGPPRTYPIAYPPYYPPTLQRVAHWFEPGELIMSDMPWAIAWYGDRQSVLISRNPDEKFLDINDWQKPVNGVHLSRLTLDQRFLSGWVLNAREWGRFIIEILTKGEVPKGFPLRKSPAFMTTFPDHILLADRIRWQDSAPVTPPKSLDSRNPEAKVSVPRTNAPAPATTGTETFRSPEAPAEKKP